ncbi:hypothetical protein [Streptomyces bottropensis]|uniref:hypothetical protein n=1 Tax=Streptomyces bottropensis TaxID=42235 RepID=UPI0036C8B1BE
MSEHTFGRRASIAGRFWTVLDGRENVVSRPFKKPRLPPGALRELNEALHRLHLLAGWPSSPTMARESTYSKSTIHAAFRSTDLPKLEVVRELADWLAGEAGRDREQEVSHFNELWVSAAQEDAVVGGDEGQPLMQTPEDGLRDERDRHRVVGSSTPRLQRNSQETGASEAATGLESYSEAWLETVELALSAILLCLFPRKSAAYEFLSTAGVPSEFYVAGDPGTIGYWVTIVEYVRGKSSVDGLEGLIKSAENASEGGEPRLPTLLGVLRDMALD